MDINMIIEQLRLAGAARNDKDLENAYSTVELAEMLNISRKSVQQKLGELSKMGKLEVGERVSQSINLKPVRIPVYRIRTD